MSNLNSVGQMSLARFLRIRSDLVKLDDKIKRKCDTEWAKGNFCFIELNVDSSPIKKCIDYLDEMDEWEQTFFNVGDKIMEFLYTENVESLDGQLREEALYINNEVKKLMIKHHLLRHEDKEKWGLA